MGKFNVLPGSFCSSGPKMLFSQDWAHLEILHLRKLFFYTRPDNSLHFNGSSTPIEVFVKVYLNEFYMNFGFTV
jgi:hypothetical protein